MGLAAKHARYLQFFDGVAGPLLDTPLQLRQNPDTTDLLSLGEAPGIASNHVVTDLFRQSEGWFLAADRILTTRTVVLAKSASSSSIRAAAGDDANPWDYHGSADHRHMAARGIPDRPAGRVSSQ
jgi:hypothetical protein